MRLQHELAVAAVAIACVVISSRSRADVPPGYQGMPIKGVPAPIPGRINLVDYDMGGLNVGFFTTHNSGAAPGPSLACLTRIQALKPWKTRFGDARQRLAQSPSAAL